MNGRVNLVAAAFALTALSYGLARFAYGLLLPQIRVDLALSATAAGWISGSAFAAYCFGIIFAFLVGDRLGARALLVMAGSAATTGMALVALAPNGGVLGAAITLAGVSTGLTSPPLASAVAQRFDDEARPKANGIINGGTAAGIVFSGFAAMSVGGAWRELYGLFALIGGAVTLWLWLAMPKGATGPKAGAVSDQATTHLRVRPAETARCSKLDRIRRGRNRPTELKLSAPVRPGLVGLCVSAFLMGASSTSIWTFGAGILRDELAFTETGIAWAWIVLGASGILGSATGLLTARYGVGRIHRIALFGMALGTVGLAAASKAPVIAFAAMGLFGATYIIATGALLIQGIAGLPDRPDLGLGIPFLALAVGQTVGAPLFGAVLERLSSRTALVCFAAVACIAMVGTEESSVL